MNTSDLVRHMAERSGKSLRALSLELGRSANWLGSTVHRGGEMRADTLAEVARACGYRLVADGHGEVVPVCEGDARDV